MRPETRRLTAALLFSLLLHAWLLSVPFGGHGLWLPGFPRQDRRIETPDLRVVVVSPQVTAVEPAVTPLVEPVQKAQVEPPVARRPAPTPSVSRATRPRQTTVAIMPKVNPGSETSPKTDVATGPAPAQPPLRADRPGDTAPRPSPAPAVIALAPIDEPKWVAPAIQAMSPPVIAAAPRVRSPETAMPSRDAAADRAPSDQEASPRPVEPTKPEASKQEEQRQAEQLEAARREAARNEAAQAERAEAARVEAARVEAARVEAAQAEAARVEAARADAARVEAARAEAARAEAARAEAARAEAARAEAARAEAARAETARAEAARAEAARVEAERADAARREAARVAMGRQLDEEAARRDAATAGAGPSLSLPPTRSGARRYKLYGRTDPNPELIQYAEAWALKIQLNYKAFDMVREAAKQRHTDPLLWVAVRSDGSVESVTFDQSSGVPALDEAVRRVIDSQKPYPAFPPGLAREYDVIEIRRTWHFDTAIRLY